MEEGVLQLARQTRQGVADVGIWPSFLPLDLCWPSTQGGWQGSIAGQPSTAAPRFRDSDPREMHGKNTWPRGQLFQESHCPEVLDGWYSFQSVDDVGEGGGEAGEQTMSHLSSASVPADYGKLE